MRNDTVALIGEAARNDIVLAKMLNVVSNSALAAAHDIIGTTLLCFSTERDRLINENFKLLKMQPAVIHAPTPADHLVAELVEVVECGYFALIASDGLWRNTSLGQEILCNHRDALANFYKTSPQEIQETFEGEVNNFKFLKGGTFEKGLTKARAILKKVEES